MRIYAMMFVTVFLAELGDKTQLATLLFASDPARSKAGVFAAAAGALMASTLLAVLVGDRLGAWVRPEVLRAVAGAGFIAIGGWMLLAR
jgi:putative Ca2+/H+ antiporter (TMEM165/GDT1 family)